LHSVRTNACAAGTLARSVPLLETVRASVRRHCQRIPVTGDGDAIELSFRQQWALGGRGRRLESGAMARAVAYMRFLGDLRRSCICCRMKRTRWVLRTLNWPLCTYHACDRRTRSQRVPRPVAQRQGV